LLDGHFAVGCMFDYFPLLDLEDKDIPIAPLEIAPNRALTVDSESTFVMAKSLINKVYAGLSNTLDLSL
jgi:hypothetical protein